MEIDELKKENKKLYEMKDQYKEYFEKMRNGFKSERYNLIYLK